MAMFNYAGPLFDFAPLAGLLDPIIEGVEKQRQEKLRLAALAPDAPVAPAAPVSTGGTPSFVGGGAKMAMPADPETERKFLDTVRSGGLTNPIAVAAIAAHVNAESGFNPANFTRTWSDPSESGKPGISGGALSWRGDRLTKMLQATQGQDPAVAQAKYALLENPEMTIALQNAKSLPEAHSILSNSQRYAGYDRSGGENARRLALAQNYYSRLGGGSDTATAETRPAAPVATASTQASAVSPQKLAALRELAVRGSPADRQWAQNEITRLTAFKSPISIGNGVLVDPRDPTKIVADYSDRTKEPEAYRLYKQGLKDPAFAAEQERKRKEELAAKDPKIKAESEYSKERAKSHAKQADEIEKEGIQAGVELGNLKVMDSLTDDPKFYSGEAAGLVTRLKRAAASMGLAGANEATPNELFAKIANKNLIDAQPEGKLGAGFSNADREFVKDSNANPNLTREGNKAIIRMNIKLAERKREIAKRARAYEKQHGKIDSDFYAELSDWGEANPVFSPDDMAVFGGALKAPAASYMPPGLPPPGVTGAGEYKVLRKLP
jgi:hypothetical protein